jgi:soluble lytic murein transglycosylase-like protein
MMIVRAQSLMAILLTGLVFGSGLALSCAPVSAQIVSVLDERGQRVYINTAPPPARAPESAKNVAPAANSLLGATKGTEIASGLNGISVAAPRVAITSIMPSSGTHGLSSVRLEELVQTTANRHGVDPNLVRAVIETESGGNPSAVSRKGAVGLMQLMPTTALELGVRNMYSAQENLEAGVRYLHTLLVRYGGDLDRALAAYNAGAGAVDRAGGVPRYRETRDYVRKVTNSYFAADASRPTSATNTPRYGLSGVETSSPLKTPGQPPVKMPPPVQPSNKIYKTTDASGHTVWTN